MSLHRRLPLRTIIFTLTLAALYALQTSAQAPAPTPANRPAEVEAAPGQTFFMEKGTPHGLRNTGSTLAMAMEVFVKDNASTAQKRAARGRWNHAAFNRSALAPLALARSAPDRPRLIVRERPGRAQSKRSPVPE